MDIGFLSSLIALKCSGTVVDWELEDLFSRPMSQKLMDETAGGFTGLYWKNIRIIPASILIFLSNGVAQLEEWQGSFMLMNFYPLKTLGRTK